MSANNLRQNSSGQRSSRSSTSGHESTSGSILKKRSDCNARLDANSSCSSSTIVGSVLVSEACSLHFLHCPTQWCNGKFGIGGTLRSPFPLPSPPLPCPLLPFPLPFLVLSFRPSSTPFLAPLNLASGSGSAVISPSGVWGEAPAEIEFGAF